MRDAGLAATRAGAVAFVVVLVWLGWPARTGRWLPWALRGFWASLALIFAGLGLQVTGS